MNGIEEIQKIIENFVEESKQVKEKISYIEKERIDLARKRNEYKNANFDEHKTEIIELGKQISELGNQSQNLQNKLDLKFYDIKQVVNLMTNNTIVEGIRKISQIEDEKEQFNYKITIQQERNAKYEIQKQEFFERFGRMPEISNYTGNEDEVQDKQCEKYKNKIEEIEYLLENQEEELLRVVELKRNFFNKNWDKITSEEVEETIILPCVEEQIEEFEIEEIEQIEEVTLQGFEPMQEVLIEEFEPLEERQSAEDRDKVIEELARAIVEQIVEEQTKQMEINKVEEKKKHEEKVELLGIMIKINNGELVYTAQISNGEEIKILPTKLKAGNALLNIKEQRNRISKMLVDYAIAGYRPIDKNIIKKIDPIICELLTNFSEKYNYDADDLIYNYAMTFSTSNIIRTEFVPIMYNMSYINETNLSKTEKREISKICRNAKANSIIDVIGEAISLKNIKHIFKRLFAINSKKGLPEGKY